MGLRMLCAIFKPRICVILWWQAAMPRCYQASLLLISQVDMWRFIFRVSIIRNSCCSMDCLIRMIPSWNILPGVACLSWRILGWTIAKCWQTIWGISIIRLSWKMLLAERAFATCDSWLIWCVLLVIILERIFLPTASGNSCFRRISQSLQHWHPIIFPIYAMPIS